jgi:hypothetical protein
MVSLRHVMPISAAAIDERRAIIIDGRSLVAHHDAARCVPDAPLSRRAGRSRRDRLRFLAASDFISARGAPARAYGNFNYAPALIYLLCRHCFTSVLVLLGHYLLRWRFIDFAAGGRRFRHARRDSMWGAILLAAILRLAPRAPERN